MAIEIKAVSEAKLKEIGTRMTELAMCYGVNNDAFFAQLGSLSAEIYAEGVQDGIGSAKEAMKRLGILRRD